MKKKFIILLVVLFSLNASAQDSSRLRISLLTCTPGDELYSIFGHSAIRITDSTSLTDIVYNYGTFNFDDKNFYIKFIRGKLLYYLSIERFEDFQFLYSATNREITEQVLLLGPEEKIHIQSALNENLREENKFYKYDFFLDNCTTRLRDLILSYKSPTPQLTAVMPETTTFRQAIHIYLDKGGHYWSKLGIDILLGMPTDAVMTPQEQQFLPDNLMNALDKSVEVKIVAQKTRLYKLQSVQKDISFLTPLVFFTTLLLIYVALTIRGGNKLNSIISNLDSLIFFLTGLLGVLLIFMTTATDHSMTKNNLNLLWAWPTHIISAFFLRTNYKWVKIYFGITALGLCFLLLAWFLLPQSMNLALIPFILLLIYRSASKYLK